MVNQSLLSDYYRTSVSEKNRKCVNSFIDLLNNDFNDLKSAVCCLMLIGTVPTAPDQEVKPCTIQLWTPPPFNMRIYLPDDGDIENLTIGRQTDRYMDSGISCCPPSTLSVTSAESEMAV